MAYTDGRCFSEVIGHTALGDDITQWICLCFMPDSEASLYQWPEDQLAIARHKVNLLVNYCLGKIPHRPGLPNWTEAQRREFIKRLPSRRYTKYGDMLPKIDYVSLDTVVRE